VIGTLINTGAVLLGGSVGLLSSKSPSERLQVNLKYLLGALVIYVGFSTTWKSLGNSGFSHVPKQLFIVFAALIAGNQIGRLLRLQERLNSVGEFARKAMTRGASGEGNRWSDGFVTCTLLFCVGPMAIIGSIEDGLNGNFRTLAIKSAMDCLAALAFARTFGWGVLASAVPVLAYQGTITLAARSIKPFLDEHPDLLYALNASGGLIVVCIAVVILEIQKVPLANYLPTLLVAPLLAWWLGF
jgi:uncharacterized membrane protein YqgA involved in biofilm formation